MVIPIENIFLAVSEYDFGHFGGSIMFRSLYMHKGRPHWILSQIDRFAVSKNQKPNRKFLMQGQNWNEN